jgi:uncharacterized repeat protein (TIGR01451 family)
MQKGDATGISTAAGVQCWSYRSRSYEGKMYRSLLPLALIATAFLLPAQEDPQKEKSQQIVPALDPGEQDGFQWMLRQRAFPLGYIPSGAGVRALRDIEAMERVRRPAVKNSPIGAIASSGGNWTMVGPAPVLANFATADLPAGGTNYFGGSIWALAVDPRNKNTVYLGGAGGGVWKTTDGGTHWTSLTDGQPYLSIGSLAIAPSSPDTLYAGTGWPFGLYGDGILKTTDAGATWSYISGPFSAPTGSTNYFGGGAKIVALAVNPSNSSIVLAAVWGWSGTNGGIFRSADGGVTWTRVLSGGRGSSVFFYPSNGNIAYASLGDYYGAAADGIYKSADGGVTWNPANGTGANVLPSVNVGTILLNPAPSNPSTMYAAVSQSGSSNFLGFFRTTDGGQNWTQPSTLLDLPADPPQTMVVSPTNPSVILTGSHDYINRSTDGGITWSRAIPPRFTDNRFFTFSADGSRLYIGDDAGAYSTDTPLTTFQMTNLNQTLSLVLFYPGLSIHPANLNIALGGAQDLGINLYGGASTWNWVYNCDGGSTAIDAATPSTVYATCQSSAPGYILKSTANGASGTWTTAQTGIPSSDHPMFIPPLIMDPSQSQRLYFGATHVYQSMNGAASWNSISPALTTDTSGFSSVSAMAVAPGNPDYLYAATAGGAAYLTQNATLGVSSVWTNITTGLPNRAVTAITVHPTSPATAYLLFSGFSGFGDSKGHIFKTVDAGAHWQDISGNLPNIPLNDCVIDPDIPGTLYAASDMAVFTSANDGASWTVLGNGLPRVIVNSLKLHEPSRTLRAATFGRSMWDLAIPLGGSTTPLLSIVKSHLGNFAKGQNGATYQVTVSNQAGAGPTSGLITVTDTIPAGLTLVSMAGTGWTCAGGSCTRSDPLSGGSSYPNITVKVNVASNEASQLTNQVNVSGGGSSTASSSDLTNISVLSCDINGDGSTNVRDLQMMINEALGMATAVHDLNQDGGVTVADVQIGINAAFDFGCSAK